MGKLFLSLLLSLVLAAPALANNTGAPRQSARETVKQQRRQTLEQIKETRETARKEMRDKREAFKKDFEARQAELKKQIEAKREELKQRLEKIKDERKKNLVQKIDKSLDELNARRLKHYSAVLDQIEKVLERVGKRAERAEERGLDVAAVKSAEEAAKAAIAASREAIKTQAGKTYKIEITTEMGLKQAVQKARQALHADLKKVEETVKAAREAVRKAAVALAQVPRVDEPESPTSTPPTTSQ
ncbi:hypothetical protein HYT45_03255 [Candidatus Uhrbacteria bacterium]|nr:hypothetical protein [Candidatus Uhrbacteria bacterium]